MKKISSVLQFEPFHARSGEITKSKGFSRKKMFNEKIEKYFNEKIAQTAKRV